MQLINGETTLPEVATRVHNSYDGQRQTASLEVLWVRKSARGSPLAEHVSAVKEELCGPGKASGRRGERTYTATLRPSRLLTANAWSEPFAPWTRDLVDMTANALGLLRTIMQIRAKPNGSQRVQSQKVRPQSIIVENDVVGTILHKARAGANGNRSTKSKVVPCPTSAYAEVMEEFGLAGVAAYPVFLGSWWMALLLHDFEDWRQDFLCILDYSFFFEYNLDRTAKGHNLMKKVAALWEMPNLPDELQVRRQHMLYSMTFFNLKLTHEAAVCNQKTDGLTAWVHTERDTWRDFKALDSGGFAHYLSYAPGVAGRNDMMLAGLVNDWVDLGPDLRYEECNQSVFALTRGSLVKNDLLCCYERTVWMLNASFASDERYVGYVAIVAACLWELCNHRQDVWRYYCLAYDLCSAVQLLDLYRIADLADCYSPDLTPIALPNAEVLPVPRRGRPYRVRIDGAEYAGSVMLHTTLCDALESGLLPATLVDYQLILPHLLRQGDIDSNTFLRHMNRNYCVHFADVMRSGHAHDFSRPYGQAIAALVMEGWWSGLYLAIGVGSLIEAQPDCIANDRAH